MQPAPLTAELRATAPDLARRVGAILLALSALIARGFLRNPRLVVLTFPLCNYIGRTIRRFTRLMARLPAINPPRPGRPSRARLPKPPYPTTKAWLLVPLKHEAAAYRYQLNHLFNQPETAALLAHFPQAGRILRPICDMLGLDHPALARPLRPQLPLPRAGEGRGLSHSDGKGEGRADARSPVAPSIFLPRPPQELCPRLVNRWPFAPHPNARPKPT